MICKSLFGRLCLAFFGVFAVNVGSVSAQCCGGGGVAYAPTYTAAYAPSVVYQTYRPNTGWYPGALLDRMRVNRWNAWNSSTTTFATTAMYAPTYTTAYTPTFPPSYYATSYRAAYPITYSASYAPTVAYSPVTSCATCCSDPCGCSREVVMRPICDSCVSPCSGCATGCSSCGGSSFVGQAVYESSGSTGCAGCTGGGASTYITPSSPSPTPAGSNGATPQPGLSPEAEVPETRVEKPEATNGTDETSVVDPNGGQDPMPAEGTDESTPSTMFQPPKLFNPGDRVTNRPNAPVWTAVYHTTAKSSRHVSRPKSTPSSAKPTAEEVAAAAQGWTSAGN